MCDADRLPSSSLIKELRTNALEIFGAGVAAADPFKAVLHCLKAGPHHLEIVLDIEDPERKRSGRWRQIFLIAFGKAACAMASAALVCLRSEFENIQGLVVTNRENAVAIPEFKVLTAGHPLPDAEGLHAVTEIQRLLATTTRDDLVLVLVSGGGSALLPGPLSPVTLVDKIATTNLLLASGASIDQINIVRKHLSSIKGGGLAKLAAPADVHTLILSDVLSNEVSSIASGPTVADPSSFSDAQAILQSKQLWHKVPAHVVEVINAGIQGQISETPKPSDQVFHRSYYTLIGSNRLSLNAIEQAAQQLHYQTLIYSDHLCGEARLEALKLVDFIGELLSNGLQQPTAILAGGETTVTLTGNGKGGRNQEFALAFALAAEQRLPKCWVLLSGGTDGRDGPTEAAGGLVDATSLTRLRTQSLDTRALLDNNDAYHALQAIDDLLITGATGTNVADLLIVLLHPLLN